MLLQSLQPSGVEDSMQWLAALELPDANVERMQQLQAQERSITAAIDRVLSQAGRAVEDSRQGQAGHRLLPSSAPP